MGFGVIKAWFVYVFRIFISFFIFVLCSISSADDFNKTKLTMVSTQAYSTLDPHVGYDWLTYETIGHICGNLMALSLSGAEESSSLLVPDLATKFDIEDSGRALIFHLNPDRFFHNGKPVRAKDIVYTLNRATNPEITTGGGALFWAIKGYEDYQNGLTEGLEGVTAESDLVVRIELVRPSRSFLFALTTNFGCVVPDGYNGGNFDIPISAGPVMVESFSEDRILTLTRFNPAAPYYTNVPKYTTIETELDIDDMLARFATGNVDIILDSLIGYGIGRTFSASSTAKPPPSLGLTYITLNTNLPPFDNKEARCAVNFAMNRDKIASTFGNLVEPTAQIAPPFFPEFDISKSANPYDVDKAVELLSNTKRPIPIDIFAVDEDSYRTVANQIAQDLQHVGFATTVRFGSHEDVLEIGRDPNRGHILLSDGLGWYPDYLDVSNFYFPLLSSNAIGGWNWAVYNNPELDKKAERADEMIYDEQADERIEAWRNIFTIAEEDCALVPIYNRIRHFMNISERASQFLPFSNRMYGFGLEKK